MAQKCFIIYLLRILVMSASVVSAITAKPCLADSFHRYIPPERRINLDIGVATKPVSIWMLNWDSAALAAELSRIIIEETLGYHVTTSQEGGNSWTTFYSLAACGDPKNYVRDPNCRRTRDFPHHIGLETWGESKIQLFQQYLEEKDMTDMMPECLGSIGYDGTDGTYVFTDIVSDAFAESGLSLEYYKSYNVSWHQPWRHFANVSDIAPSRLKFCNQTRMQDARFGTMHLTVTGDKEGLVINQTTGEVMMFRCWRHSWWISPACRKQLGHCIPWMTGSSGWGIHDWMQKAAYYNVPVAVAVAKDNAEWRAIPQELGVLTYWWQPDASFIDFFPQRMIFPPRNYEQWAKGNMLTASSKTLLSKCVYIGMQFDSPKLYQFVDKLQISSTSMETMLYNLKVNLNATHRDVACEWLLRSGDTWQSWIPDPTGCLPGYGLVSSSGQFLETLHLASNQDLSRKNATGCEKCPAGKKSVKYYEDGLTFTCQSCYAGSFTKEKAMTACIECSAGKFTANNGSEKCELCEIGKFATSSGIQQCQQCRVGRTTQFPGASATAQCVCPEGAFFNFDSDTCDVCLEGMVCDIGSNLSFLPGEDIRNECPEAVLCTYPKVMFGYMSTVEKPLRIYRCLIKEQCPGGNPGTCARHRDATEVACGICVEGSYDDGDECEPCEGGKRGLLFVLVCTCAIIVLIVATFVVNKDISMQSKSSSLILVMAGQLCTTVQTMALFLNIQIEWVGPLRDIFWFFSLLRLDLRFLGLNCLFKVNSLLNYLCSQLTIPAGVFWIAFTLVVKRGMLKRATHLKEEFTNTVGVLFSMFFISIVTSAVTPIICYRHPGDSGTSLTTNPAVLCFETDVHRAMLIIGISAMLLLVFPFVALAGYGTAKYPHMIAESSEENSKRLAMFRFLFFRFKGETYYYACISMVRNLFLCFVPAVIRENAASQVIAMSLVLVSFGMLQLILLPWRTRVANVCDGIIVNGMVLLLMVAAVFNDFSTKDDGSLEVLGIGLFAACMAVCICTIAWGILYFIVPRPFYEWFVCHHKAAASAQARNVKILLERADNFKKNVFIDSDDLFDLEDLFDTVKCKIAHLVVYLTPELLTRPWCAGEITTTYKDNARAIKTSPFRTICGKKKPAVVTCIKTLGFEFPNTTQLNNLGDYIDHSSFSLVSYNITIADVKRAYEWLMKTTIVELDSLSLGRDRLRMAINKMLSRTRITAKNSLINRTHWDDAVVVSTDPDDEEATSTAAVLLHYIERDVATITQRPPVMLVETEDVNVYTYMKAMSRCRAIVIILTRDSLRCPPQLDVVVTATMYSDNGRQHGIIPVHTPAFTFPGSTVYENGLVKKQVSDQLHLFFPCDVISSALKEFLKKISMFLGTHASERVLQAQAHDVFLRIPTNHVAEWNEIQESRSWSINLCNVKKDPEELISEVDSKEFEI